jgi:predicted GH43/DUF377 family glycosyl hydrolase
MIKNILTTKPVLLFVTAMWLLTPVSCKEKRNALVEHHTVPKNWMLKGFIKADSINPILQPATSNSFIDPINKELTFWEAKNVLNPSAVVREGKVHLLYRAQDSAMTSRLGLAISNDGLHFKTQPAPDFYPDNDEMNTYEWPGGVEDPRVIESEEGTYIMTYTAYDGKTARLCLASSKDLKHWVKHGLVLKNENYKDTWSKSGAIVCEQRNGKTVAIKIKGKYWMYFGDTSLFVATSDDLINWEVAIDDENKKMIAVLHPRPGYFDSRLVEPGPFALVKDEGILLIYNGSNAANYNDPDLPKFTYASGQALFDKENPVKLVDRSKSHFLHPDKPYEKTGEVNEVCFVEGLVYFQNKWLLYYGTADSKIAVAVKQ